MANNNHFTLTLDTLAPVGSISRGDSRYVKENFNLSIVKDDATYMYVWFDKVDKPADIPADLEPIPADTSYTTEFIEAGEYYYHLVLMDDLNNRSDIYSTDPITYDTTKPVVGTVTLNDGAAITNSRSVKIKFTFTDATPSSGCVSYTLSGALADSVSKTGTFSGEEISKGVAERDIVLDGAGEVDETKIVSVTVTDNAGNTSDAKSASIQLDTEYLKGSIVIRDGADSHNINETWVNYQDIIVQLALTPGVEADCVGYKIWGDVNTDGSATPSGEPMNYISNVKGAPIAVAMKLTSGDAAAKNIHAKVIDDAGNETELTSVFVKYDATAPTVSIEAVGAESAPKFVSEVARFNTVTITPNVDASISDVASYVLLKDDVETTKTGIDAVPATITFAAADMGAEGAHTFKLKVTDKAGNTTTSAAVTITKDTTGPVGNVVMSGWANKETYPKLGVTASATDNLTTVAFMECWVSSVEKDTVVPEGTTKLAYSENPEHGMVNWTAKAESATNYIHIRYTDAVGNTAIAHSGAFGVDTIAPGVGTITLDKDAYDTVNGIATISSSDATSGLDEMMLTGPIEGSDVWEKYAASRNIVFTGEDGNKTVTIKFKDKAGNVSEGPDASATAELDRVFPSLEITMLEDDDTTIKPAISNKGSFILHFTGHDDKGLPVSAKDLEYKVYGDFNTTPDQLDAVKETDVEFAQVEFEAGKDYVKTPVLYATQDTSSTGDGTLKTIYVKIRDNAGNITTKTVTFTYDNSAPEVTVSDIDYNRISTVHELRFQTVGGTVSEIASKFADEIHFTFTPSTKIQAYQVCAYVDADAAKVGDHTKGQIGKAAGSQNMAATGLNSSEAVTCMIKGEDYQDVVVTDGAHIVVVYVQDLGGTWSVAASFSA